jgi:SAM-dependent methyltransferase
MQLFRTLIETISDHPVLFIAIRGVLENDFKAIRAIIRRELRPGTGIRTLDLGCGPGAFADLFKGDDLFGVDLNARYIAYAKEHYAGTFLVSDARKIDLPDRRFDQILVFGLLHHLSDEEVRAVLAECARLLADGGRALVVEDIPAISRVNLIGHLIHAAENGEHIRRPEEYRTLYTERFAIAREEVLKSGICDYYAAVLVAPPAGART